MQRLAFPGDLETPGNGNICRLQQELRKRELRSKFKISKTKSGVIGLAMGILAAVSPDPAYTQDTTTAKSDFFQVAPLPYDIQPDLVRHELEGFGFSSGQIDGYFSLMDTETMGKLGPIFQDIYESSGIYIVGGDIAFFIDLVTAQKSGDFETTSQQIDFLVELYPVISTLGDILTKHGFSKQL